MPIAAAAQAEGGKREDTMLLTASTSEDYASATTREKKVNYRYRYRDS